MGCRVKPYRRRDGTKVKGYTRIRSKDVGRKGHHYIKIGVRETKGKRGGRTERIGGLRAYKGGGML